MDPIVEVGVVGDVGVVVVVLPVVLLVVGDPGDVRIELTGIT